LAAVIDPALPGRQRETGAAGRPWPGCGDQPRRRSGTIWGRSRGQVPGRDDLPGVEELPRAGTLAAGVPLLAGEVRVKSHFATCSEPGRFRRKRADGD